MGLRTSMKHRIKRNNQGFTLVEVVIAMALISVLMSMITVVVCSCGKNYIDLLSFTRACELSEQIASGFRRIGTESSALSIEEDDGGWNVSLELENGTTNLFYGEESLNAKWTAVPLTKDGASIGVAVLGRPLISFCLTDAGNYYDYYLVALIDVHGNTCIYVVDKNPLDSSLDTGIPGLLSGSTMDFDSVKSALYNGTCKVYSTDYITLICDDYYGIDGGLVPTL